MDGYQIPISKDLIDDSVLYDDYSRKLAHETAVNLLIILEKQMGLVTDETWQYDKHNDTALRLRLEQTQKDLGYVDRR